MRYWVGGEAEIKAANDSSVAAYLTANPNAECSGETMPNPTTAWAVPAQTAAGDWAILAYPGLDAPDGVSEVETVEWSDTE